MVTQRQNAPAAQDDELALVLDQARRRAMTGHLPRLLFSGCLSVVLFACSAGAQTPAKPPTPVWDTAVAGSFVGTSGNTDTTTLGADYSMHHHWPAWQVESAASAVRTTDNGTKTAERYLGAFRGQRKLTSLLSLSAGERAERDQLAGMDFRSILDAGLTWQLVRQARWTLDGTTAIAWNHEHPTVGPIRDHPIGLLQLTSHVPFGTNADATARYTFYPDFSTASDYRSEAEGAAQASMNSHLALKLGYLWRFSNAPAVGFKKADGVATASIVVHWKSTATLP